MLFNHDSGLIQSILTIDTSVAPALGGSNTLQIIGTGGLILPVGTAAQRPQTPVAGTQRFNSDRNQVEYYNGTAWIEGADGTVQSITVTSSDVGGLTVNGGATATVTTTGTFAIALDPTLVNLAKSVPSASGGPVVRLADDTFISRSFYATAPVTIVNGDGVAGDPTISVNAELTGLSTQSAVGYVYRTGAGAYTEKTLAVSGDLTLTLSGDTTTFGYTASGDLAALTALGNGIVVKTGVHTYAAGTIGVSGTELSITGANTATPVITYTPSANVAAVNALTGTGYVTRQADGSLVQHSITGTTSTTTGSIVVTDGGSVTGTSISFTPGVELAKLAATAAHGVLVRDTTGAYTGHNIVGAHNITVTNGTGDTAGDITIDYNAGANLTALAALAGTGYLVQTASGAFVENTFAVGAGVTAGHLTVTNGSGVAGATSFDFVAGTEIAGLAALSTLGLVARTAAGAYLPVTLTADAASATGQITVTHGAGDANPVIGFTAGTEIAGLAALGTSGLVVRTAAGAYTGTSLTGSTSSAGTLSWTNASGVTGSPTLAFTPAANIAALATTAVTGLLSRDGAGAITGKTVVGQGSIVVSYSGDNINISYTAGANLGSLDSLSGLGFVMQTSAHGFEERVLAGVTGNTVITNANGVNGNPTVDLAPVTQATSGTFSKVTLDSFGRVTGNTPVTTADITALADATYVNVTGDTMTGALSMGGFAITNLATPTNNTDAVTKLYVDAMSTGLSWKQSVKAATTGNVALTGAQLVDGVTMVDGDRVLVRTQTNLAENGIWIYSATGAWSRAADLDSPQESKAATMFVEQGATLANSAWTQKDIVSAIGSSPLEFVQFAGAGSYSAGTGLTLTGNSFAITSPIATTLGGTGLSTIGTSGQVLGVGASGNLEYKSIVAGAGTTVTATAGQLAVANTGVLSNIAGTGISIDATTGNSTISNTGVLTVSTVGTGIVNTVAHNGVVTITGNAVATATAGRGITAVVTAGDIAITNTGILSATAAGTGVSVSTDAFGALTITGSATAVHAGLGINVTQTGGDATIRNTGVVVLASGTASLATAFDAVTGTATVTNNGITSAVAGTGITVSNSGVGAATIANDGVLTVAITGSGITNFAAAKGVLSIVGTGVDTIGVVSGVSASITGGVLAIANTGVTGLSSTNTGITVSTATGAVTLTNTGVLGLTTIGAGVAVTGTNATGLVITNTGVTSNVAGTGIHIDNATGVSTVSNTGVLSVTTTGAGLTALSSATGVVSFSNTGVTSTVAGTGITVSDATGAVTIATTAVLSATGGTGISITGTNAGGLTVANTGVVTLAGTANEVTVANTGTAFTVSLPASVTIDTALTVTGLGANKTLITGAAGLVSGVALTNGQFLIGATGAAPAAATITAGTGVTVTPSANGLTIGLSGGAAAVTSVTGAIAVGSTAALTVTNTGTAQAPVITYGVAAGLESLTSLAAQAGLVSVDATGTVFTARSLVAGTGVSLSNTTGSGDITIANTGVTSVGLALPSIFGVSGSPVTTTGTLTATLASQASAVVFAGPATGSNAAPTFRALAYTDLPIALYAESTTAKTVDLTANEVSHASGNFAVAGDAAAVEMVLRNTTATATPTEAFVDGAALRAALPTNGTWVFTVQVVGRGTGAACAYRFDGIISKDSANSSTAFIGVPSKAILGETTTLTDANVTADATNGALAVTVTGLAATSMKWVATVRATQVIG